VSNYVLLLFYHHLSRREQLPFDRQLTRLLDYGDIIGLHPAKEIVAEDRSAVIFFSPSMMAAKTHSKMAFPS
jgi:hypothetical protein